LEILAKAIYPLNVYSGPSVCPATAWIISGLRNRCKNDTAPIPEPLVFMSVAPTPELFFFIALRLQLRLLVVFTH